ncbi:MAG TPA: hypothetical protein VJN92_08425 [Candidatus Acidoferrum sp.]|nr:hypothetical protein [Candidatus Acidoferrum sp.]
MKLHTGQSAGARAERPGSEQSRPDTQAAERRRNVLEKIAAARAAAIVGYRAGDIHPQPMAARLTQRVDALHGQAGQVLHSFTSEAAKPGNSTANML